jgi:ATP-dependent Clp protease ATP-binding subunit ClpA
MIGTYLFLGPSGVGKTELAKAIGDVAFGPKPGVVEPHLIRIDCGRLTEQRDIVQLLGAPQGLVGYREGVLTNGLRDKGGRCVIIFDEAEKANRHIWQSLLTFFDEGIVTEADGTRYDATGCILVATSNLGYKEAGEAFGLFDLSHEDAHALRPQVEEFIWAKVNDYFSPEFLGRFGRENVVLFNHFGKHDYRTIIANQVGALIDEMTARGLLCTVEEPVVDRLAEFAWERRKEGARTVRRLVTGYLRDQIVDGLTADLQRTDFHFLLREDGDIAVRDR